MDEIVRLDKWLWAARFFKTRSMAQQAVEGGKVEVNGNRGKAAHRVVEGDRLIITIGFYQMHVTVLAISKLRGPATTARLLYLESEESIATRTEQKELRRLQQAGFTAPPQRPSKRDRRKIKQFTRKD
jgi:ribosome-associated heat shock protein Hsp15